MPDKRVADLLGFQLAVAIRKLQKTYEASFTPHGVTPSQALVLDQLWLEDGLQPRDISERAHLDPTSVNWLVSQLEKAGLLELRKDPADRRAVRLWLTPAGQELRDRVLPEVRRLHLSVAGVLLRYMPPAALEALDQGLRVLVDQLPEGDGLLAAVAAEWEKRMERLRRLVEADSNQREEGK